jgi:hypothetical protein
MGYDQSSRMVLGIQLLESDVDYVEIVAACDHVHSSKFCPECGRPAAVRQKLEHFDKYDELGSFSVVFGNVDADSYGEGLDENTVTVGTVLNDAGRAELELLNEDHEKEIRALLTAHGISPTAGTYGLFLTACGDV